MIHLLTHKPVKSLFVYLSPRSTDVLSAQWGESQSDITALALASFSSFSSLCGTMVLQYTRGELNEVFVEMKNVIINLITDSNIDLWMNIGRQERWKIKFGDRSSACR